jgi:hypothetical protein
MTRGSTALSAARNSARQVTAMSVRRYGRTNWNDRKVS